MKTPVAKLATTPEKVVVDVPRQVFRLDKKVLVAAGVGVAAGVVATVVTAKVKNRNKVVVEVPETPADAA